MSAKQRVFFVIDMKSFFASVECAERGLDPMTTNLVVADPTRTEKTVCLAITPNMKKLGIINRCRLFEIPKTVDFIIAPPRMKKYIDYAAEIYGIYLQYIDKNDIHVYSIDECFIDATDYLKMYNMRAKEFAQKLMNEIWDKLRIPSTAGIGSNMYLAKIALDITAKHSPDRIGWLTEEKFIKELWHHQPIDDFWGISKGTVARLAKYGIIDQSGIAHASEEDLYQEFGVNAELLIDHAWGRETCTIADIKAYQPKSHSLSTSQILPCNYDFKDAKVVMQEMILNGCYDLARQHYATQLIHLYVGYADHTIDKGSTRMNVCTNAHSIISSHAEKLFDKIVNPKKPIRKLGYDFGDLVSDSQEFYDFFTDTKQIEREKQLTNAILGIQDKYGKNALLKGINYQEKATQRERNKMIGGHSSGEN